MSEIHIIFRADLCRDTPQEAANSLAAYSEGGTAYSGTDVSSSYASSFSSYASGTPARPTETDVANMPVNNRDDMLAARPTQKAVTETRRDSLNLLGIFASISEVFATKETGDELSEEDRQALLKHWDNYDIHRTLKPNLLPKDEAYAGEVILAAFRINQARKKCYRIKQDKMQRETNKCGSPPFIHSIPPIPSLLPTAVHIWSAPPSPS